MVLNVNHHSCLSMKTATGGVIAKRAVLNVAMNSSTGFASLLKKNQYHPTPPKKTTKKRGVGEEEGGESRLYLYVKIHYLPVIEK